MTTHVNVKQNIARSAKKTESGILTHSGSNFYRTSRIK